MITREIPWKQHTDILYVMTPKKSWYESHCESIRRSRKAKPSCSAALFFAIFSPLGSKNIKRCTHTGAAKCRGDSDRVLTSSQSASQSGYNESCRGGSRRHGHAGWNRGFSCVTTPECYQGSARRRRAIQRYGTGGTGRGSHCRWIYG